VAALPWGTKSMKEAVFSNQAVRPSVAGGRPGRAALDFHRRLPGYAPTPLLAATGLARRMGIGQLWIKDESARFGLPAFKILGASWAVYRALIARSGGRIGAWSSLAALRTQLAALGPLTFAAATDGNHGRAVARMAALLGYGARIFVPAGTAKARINAIAGEGATVTVVPGTYDDAVARAADEASSSCLVISDTSWPGYEDVPRWVIEGYSTICWEVADELARLGQPGPDFVVVQMGVGALAAAVIQHFHAPDARQRHILGVEPTSAACVLASLQAGQLVAVPGPHTSIMAGLNCGTPSMIAWPQLAAGLDAVVAIDDERARQAMREFAAIGLVAGETGAAGLGGLLALLESDQFGSMRGQLSIGPATRVLVFCTEGATDPAAYARIIADAKQ
jgi:diaminopropionate ammonia-lyase